MRHDWTRRTLMGICAIALLAALGRAEDGGAEPEGEAETPATATLAGGRVEYAPPAGWASKSSEKEHARLHFSPSRESAIAIEVWPPGGQLDGGIGGAMVRKLRETRRQNGTKVLMAAKQEKDKRFAIRIHEQYEREMPAKEGKEPEKRVVDQLHLYRKVGPRVVMVTINSVAKEDEQVQEVHRMGEAVAMSAKYVPPPKPGKRRGRDDKVTR